MTDPDRHNYPECSGDPACCPENEGHGCCMPNPKPARGIGDQRALADVIIKALGLPPHVVSLELRIAVNEATTVRCEFFPLAPDKPALLNLEAVLREFELHPRDVPRKLHFEDGPA